jgi:HK97 gp10 family phage protein
MFTVHFDVQGVDEIARAFRELEPKLARKVIRQAERKGLRIPLAVARGLAPVRTGKGRRSLRIRSSKGPRSGAKKQIAMALLVGDAHGPTWYMFLQEHGYHTGKRIRHAGKVIGRSVGSRPIPGKRFMRQALRSSEEQVKQIISSEIVAGIEREAHA